MQKHPVKRRLPRPGDPPTPTALLYLPFSPFIKDELNPNHHRYIWPFSPSFSCLSSLSSFPCLHTSATSKSSSDYLNNMGITFTAASPILPSVDLGHDGLMQSTGKDLLKDLLPVDISATSTSLKKAAKDTSSLKQSTSQDVTVKKATKDTTVTTSKTVPFKPEDEAVSSGRYLRSFPTHFSISYLPFLLHPISI